VSGASVAADVARAEVQPAVVVVVIEAPRLARVDRLTARLAEALTEGSSAELARALPQ
jgi:hypothetical protein